MASVSLEALENARSETMDLTLAQLKVVARNQKLPVSGAKAVLQERIKDKLTEYVRRNDIVNFQRIADLISRPERVTKNDETYNLNSLSGSQSACTMGGGSTPSSQSKSHEQVRPIFKDSPFYVIKSAITPVQECKVDNPQSIFQLLAKQQPHESPKFMIYCAPDPISQFCKVDIAFPSQIEIKVNGNEVKANMRGLKNKPGSTRPADITDLIHKKPNYVNSMTVTYALTTKRFYLIVNLVHQIRPDRLVQDLKNRSSISKDQVMREMVNKAQDTDIQTTSSIMSLKCPLSTLRMNVPCRSTVCAHNQCYDALSFLQLQEQAPTWTCPICSRPVAFESLHVDEYVDEILRSTAPSVDQVTVEPDGKWSEISPDDSPLRGARSSSEDDDDLIEIQEPPVIKAIRKDALLTPASMGRTPPQSSREQSIASVNARSNGGKRSVSAVIDLTFSSDDDDPPRASKKHANRQLGPPSIHQSNSLGLQNSQTSRPAGVSFSMPQNSDRSPGHVVFGSGR